MALHGLDAVEEELVLTLSSPNPRVPYSRFASCGCVIRTLLSCTCPEPSAWRLDALENKALVMTCLKPNPPFLFPIPNQVCELWLRHPDVALLYVSEAVRMALHGSDAVEEELFLTRSSPNPRDSFARFANCGCGIRTSLHYTCPKPSACPYTVRTPWTKSWTRCWPARGSPPAATTRRCCRAGTPNSQRCARVLHFSFFWCFGGFRIRYWCRGRRFRNNIKVLGPLFLLLSAIMNLLQLL